jgi:hypothetical protein
MRIEDQQIEFISIRRIERTWQSADRVFARQLNDADTCDSSEVLVFVVKHAHR